MKLLESAQSRRNSYNSLWLYMLLLSKYYPLKIYLWREKHYHNMQYPDKGYIPWTHKPMSIVHNFFLFTLTHKTGKEKSHGGLLQRALISRTKTKWLPLSTLFLWRYDCHALSRAEKNTALWIVAIYYTKILFIRHPQNSSGSITTQHWLYSSRCTPIWMKIVPLTSHTSFYRLLPIWRKCNWL